MQWDSAMLVSVIHCVHSQLFCSLNEAQEELLQIFLTGLIKKIKFLIVNFHSVLKNEEILIHSRSCSL